MLLDTYNKASFYCTNGAQYWPQMQETSSRELYAVSIAHLKLRGGRAANAQDINSMPFSTIPIPLAL